MCCNDVCGWVEGFDIEKKKWVSWFVFDIDVVQQWGLNGENCYLGPMLSQAPKKSQNTPILASRILWFLWNTKILYFMWQNTQFRLLGNKILKNEFFDNYETKLCVLCPDVHDKGELLRLTKISSFRLQNTQFRLLGHKISKNWRFDNYETKLCVLCPYVRDNASLL
jgi:hypothetical protein